MVVLLRKSGMEPSAWNRAWVAELRKLSSCRAVSAILRCVVWLERASWGLPSNMFYSHAFVSLGDQEPIGLWRACWFVLVNALAHLTLWKNNKLHREENERSLSNLASLFVSQNASVQDMVQLFPVASSSFHKSPEVSLSHANFSADVLTVQFPPVLTLLVILRS